MAHLHKLSGWPLFGWNSDRIAPLLARLRYSQGFFARRAMGLEAGAQNEAARLVLERDSRQGLGHILADIRQNPHGLLTASRLFTWEKSLGGPGEWRAESVGQDIQNDMKVFLAWFNFDTLPQDGSSPSALWKDPIIKAGIARLWLAAIKPFSQSSGLIAAAVCELALMRADAGKAWYSMLDDNGEAEAAIQKALGGGLDITLWLEDYLLLLEKSVASAEALIAPALRRDRTVGKIRSNPLGERQKLVLSMLLDDDKKKISSGAYAAAAACSSDTALRDIQELVALGLLRKNRAGGRSTTYSLKA